MNNNLTKKLELILRVAVSMTFLGHGMVALGGSVKWLVYLETAGFSIESAKDVIGGGHLNSKSVKFGFTSSVDQPIPSAAICSNSGWHTKKFARGVD